MLTTLRIQNFKCLRDISLSLSSFNVIIGKNDTGKTSFLDAVHLLAQMVSPRVPSLAAAWSVENLLSHDSSETEIIWDADIRVLGGTSKSSAAHYKLGIGPSIRRDLPYRVTQESLVTDFKDLSITRSHQLNPHVTDIMLEVREGTVVQPFTASVQPALSWARSIGSFRNLSSVARSMSSTMLYRLDPQVLGSPARFHAQEDGRGIEERLGHDGDGLPVVLYSMVGSRRSAFEQLETELREFAPYIQSIKLSTRILEQGPGAVLSFMLADGQDTPAQLMSDGVMLYLTYLTLVYGPSTPSIILIEEPENGMHPAALQRVVKVLQRLTNPAVTGRPVQVILTTHSPYLLDHVPRESVIVFGRDAKGSSVARRLTEMPAAMERLQTGYSLGEMWFNVGEDALLSDQGQ